MICYVCETRVPSVFVPAKWVFQNKNAVGDVAVCRDCYKSLIDHIAEEGQI